MADRGGFKREKTTGEWIRDYLDQHDEAYVKELHNAFTEWCDDHGYTPPTYNSFRRTVWILKDLGLIEVAREEPGSNPALADRRYYRRSVDVPSEHPGWVNPNKIKYD